jgi:hypothetical protein
MEVSNNEEINKRLDKLILDILNMSEWSNADINDLPDSSFAWIENGGTKDIDGKTTPRGLRHLPYKDANGKIDLAHVRNALARLNQVKNMPAEVRDDIMNKLEKILKENK